MLQQCLPFTVLKPKGILADDEVLVALQQCLPFTVLKHSIGVLLSDASTTFKLQQCLPFTVLKLGALLL